MTAENITWLSRALIAALDQPFRYPGEIKAAKDRLAAALAAPSTADLVAHETPNASDNGACVQPASGEVAEAGQVGAEQITVADAMTVVRKAMTDDPEYAWAWHCNIAMAFVDEGGDHAVGNHAAAHFLRSLAGVEPAHELPHKIAATPASPQAPAPQAVVGEALLHLQGAFRTTEVHGDMVASKQRFRMIFTFPTLEALHAADDEWMHLTGSDSQRCASLSAGLSIAAGEAIATIPTVVEASEPDWRHTKLQSMLSREARNRIETRMIGEVLDAATVDELGDVYSNDYETELFERVKELKRAALTSPAPSAEARGPYFEEQPDGTVLPIGPDEYLASPAGPASAAPHQGADALREASKALLAVLPQPGSRHWNTYFAAPQIESLRAALAHHQAPQQGEQQ